MVSLNHRKEREPCSSLDIMTIKGNASLRVLRRAKILQSDIANLRISRMKMEIPKAIEYDDWLEIIVNL